MLCCAKSKYRDMLYNVVSVAQCSYIISYKVHVCPQVGDLAKILSYENLNKMLADRILVKILPRSCLTRILRVHSFGPIPE